MAMNYQNVKTTLMDFYGVTATELDNGRNGVPHCVYCIKSFFRYKGQWVPADTVKIGRSFSVANRLRVYGQPGSDNRLLWNIDCANSKFANSLEDAVQETAQPRHAQFTHAKEIFEMDVMKAYSFLDEIEEKFNLKNNAGVKRINRYTPKIMEVYEVDTNSTKHIPISSRHTADLKYSELFDEISISNA